MGEGEGEGEGEGQEEDVQARKPCLQIWRPGIDVLAWLGALEREVGPAVRSMVRAGRWLPTFCISPHARTQVAAVLEYATHNNVEPFLEPVLDLCHAIVQRDAREVEAGRSQVGFWCLCACGGTRPAGTCPCLHHHVHARTTWHVHTCARIHLHTPHIHVRAR